MPKFPSCRRRSTRVLTQLAAVIVSMGVSFAAVAGEPAEEFLKRLRAAKYFDTAVVYLDRLDEYPGVSPELSSAIALEKAQTFIEAARSKRNSDGRDEWLGQAAAQLTEFLKQESHPRVSEARLQLGKLQMVRALQLLSGDADETKRAAARASFLAAAATFDAIVEQLRTALTEMQGARVDADKDPELAALRDQYRGEFLQAMSSLGEARHRAAKTYTDPGTEGKELLQQALATFTDLSDKYDTYVPGAMAMLHRGEVQQDLGMTQQAMDSFMRMVEQPEADPLRLAKFQATTGIIRLLLAETPPRYQAAIDRGQPMLDAARPDEREDPVVQELRFELAQTYLVKSNDTDHPKPAETKRAESEGRQLLIKISKTTGLFAEKANAMLIDMGIDLNKAAEIPTTEDPLSLEDALERARELLAVTDQLQQSLQVLEGQQNPSDEILSQIEGNRSQMRDSRAIAIQLLRRGLALMTIRDDNELVNQTRQYLAYLLYQQEQHREAAVVGTFLAVNAPGSEMGLRGGLLALNSLQLLLVDDPDNGVAISNLEQLGNYLTRIWPEDPEAAAAQGVMVKLALRGDRWDESRKRIEAMPEGAERAYFHRLMGQLLWNKSIQTRQGGDEVEADRLLAESVKELTSGLEGIPGNLVDPEAMKAALVLVKAELKQGSIRAAQETLQHNKYGPLGLIERQGTPDEGFASDLYSTQLQVLVQRMTTESGETGELLQQATEVMEKLRESITGPDSQQELTRIYMLMARDIREQLDDADAAQRAKLVEAFRVFLDRIANTTEDVATLQWVGQTLMDLAETSMVTGAAHAKGIAAGLLTTAVNTFERLGQTEGESSQVVKYQLGRAHRMLGNFQASLQVLESLLQEKPTMLDAQTEAALAYEQWAPMVPPKYMANAYQKALIGARPDDKQQNVVWGWGKISTMTSRDPKFRDQFFNARYHVALCRFLWGKAEADATQQKKLIEKSATDITQVAALYPEMGGPAQRAKFDALLKLIQKELGQPEVGLPAASTAAK